VPQEPGKPKRKLPERADALKIDLPFEDALKAAVEVKPEQHPPKTKQKRRRKQ
jgi:hypothetical protein